MDNVVIVVPTEREAAFFESHDLRAHICGVGMAECGAAIAYLLAERGAPDLMVLAGIAGCGPHGQSVAACESWALEIGDTVVVASETVADLGRREVDGSFTPMFQKTYHASVVPAGWPVVDSATVSMAGATGIFGEHGSPRSAPDGVGWGRPVEMPVPTIENMEGAAFFAVCERFGVQAMEVRAISNRVGEAVTVENLDTAARNLAASVAKILNNLDTL